jgi:hypothetical protein
MTTKTATKAKPKAKAPRKPKATPSVMGRPTKYTPELCDLICTQLAAGMSLRTVCEPKSMPSAVSVFAWMRKYPDFLKQYARAKVESADALVEEMLDIADDGRNDWMEVFDKEGECVGYKVNGEHVQRSKLRVDTRKWAASKLSPKKYGDKLDLNHDVKEGGVLHELFAQLCPKTFGPVLE